jgi:hypothetical protein
MGVAPWVWPLSRGYACVGLSFLARRFSYVAGAVHNGPD